ncbi:hypothetical protein [Streptomyces venezuelae]|uniref:hypothetical protein n=1 Tax=Streptomyces venezuelae TaxID=54571 RepID=UPI00331F0F2C
MEYDWWTAEFGDVHAGAAGVLVGGKEPGPVYIDIGSGPNILSTTHWTAYGGQGGHPRAEAIRATCACGWRGTAHYPVDWTAIGDQPLHQADIDLTGPLTDWTAHLSAVRDAAVPLPTPLTALLAEITEQLNTTAVNDPLAALRAAGFLERIATRATQEAAAAVRDDGIHAETLATALATTRTKALVLLLTAQDR